MPELIDAEIAFAGVDDYPSPPLDRAFRGIAWQAVVSHPLSGVIDEDNDGMGDQH